MYCNISMFGGQAFVVESSGMCNYANYHAVMLVVCGFLSVGMMLLACVGSACCGPAVDIEGCVMWAAVFFCLMAGFEGSFLLFVAMVYVCLFWVILSRALRHCRRRLVHPVIAVEEDVVVGIPVPGTTAAVAAVELVAGSVVEDSCCTAV
jgi:hypothetical protein